MKASIDLNTGLMIESQSSADDQTLLSNAVTAGFLNVEIRTVTDEEHASLIAARDLATIDPKVTIQAQIDRLEREQLLPRVTREGLLLTMETFAAMQGVTPEQLYVANIAYHKVKDFDNEIILLRAQL